MRRVYSSFNLAAVHHAKNVLAAHGIRAMVKNEYLSSAMGDLPPAECQAELWLLDAADLWRAEQLLFSQEHEGAEWSCVCGESLGPQFTQCWNCGMYRTAGA